jgi:hypothetical protein
VLAVEDNGEQVCVDGSGVNELDSDVAHVCRRLLQANGLKDAVILAPAVPY